MLKQASWLLALGVAAAAQITAAPAALAEYPEKPVKIIVPYPPGGATDVFTRVAAQYLEAELGQPIVIVNMKGAGGAVGMLEAMNSRPDGYTVGMYFTNTEVTQAVGVAAFTNDDFDPACHLGDIYLTLTAKGDGPYQTFEDYREAALATPGEVSVAMGVGSLAQFAAGMMADEMGVELKQVNAGGGAEKKAAVLGGHVDALIEPTPGVVGPHKDGSLRILAVFSPERLGFAPDLPTGKELGVDLVLSQANGFFFPNGTPAEAVDTFCSALGSLGQNAEFQAKMDEMNLIWNFMEGEEYEAFVAQNHEEIMAVGKKLGY